MKRWIVAMIALIVLSYGADAAPLRTPLEVHTAATSYQFKVEVAKSPKQQVQGLLFRPQMKNHEGMLFDYRGQTRPVEMWLNDTNYPLDVIVIDWKGKVLEVHEKIAPRTRERVELPETSMFVLQINSGMSKRIKIRKKSTVVHRAIRQSAQKEPAHLQRTDSMFSNWF